MAVRWVLALALDKLDLGSDVTND